MFLRNTISFCPECYKKIPADIYDDNGSVFMAKTCSEHGQSISMVERSLDYWLKCMDNPAPKIYNGYFLDATERCNIKCRYCFYPTDSKKDRSIDSIIQEVQSAKGLGPYILTGGEPTLRDDLSELLKSMKDYCPTNSTLTNGVKMTPELLDKIIPYIANLNGIIGIDLSMHKESNGKDYELLETVRSMGLKLNSVLFVIDDVSQIDEVIKFAGFYSDVISGIRIKAATKLWNEDKPKERIYVSDMLKHIGRYPYRNIWWKNNKVSFFNIEINKVWIMLVTWYDRFNVDILDINCAPYYMAHNGVIENFVTASIINEGIDKGWLNGRKLNA